MSAIIRDVVHNRYKSQTKRKHKNWNKDVKRITQICYIYAKLGLCNASVSYHTFEADEQEYITERLKEIGYLVHLTAIGCVISWESYIAANHMGSFQYTPHSSPSPSAPSSNTQS
jgi:predicted membrane channel-forming protein YqfA (hemolysin III family)